MVKCPFCKHDIDNLQYDSYVKVSQDAYLNGNAMEYGEMGDYGNHKDESYACPLCLNIITHDDDKAEAFLKGNPVKLSKSKKVVFIEEHQKKPEKVYKGLKPMSAVLKDYEKESKRIRA